MLVGFLSGVGVSMLAVAAGFALQHWKEQRARVSSATFQVYMMLMQLHGDYFWLSSAEFRQEEFDPEIKLRLKLTAWKIADKLREEDRVPQMERILGLLMSEEECKTAAERYDAIGYVLDQLGAEVNPRYAQAIKKFSERNVMNAAQKGFRNCNAPGLFF